ncbi:restriction endonuclease subunit S [Metabacillus sp. YM-086]|uniref:restriction endonuclease subunit S n=1 Tax=Metabacillus sp. YM-086 TaxID=3341729 RepID=UPI003A840768
MSEWKRYRLEEVCESIVDCVNRTAPKVDYKTPFKMIRTTNVKNGRIDLDSVFYVTEEIYDKWTRRLVPKIDDVILTREAPLGEVGIIRSNEKVFLGQRLMHYRANKELLDPYFLYYSLQSPLLQQQIHSSSMGSTVSHIRVPDAMKFELLLPPLNIQQSISTILKSIDDKIEINHKMNQTLEQMAITLYKHWFVDFGPFQDGEFVESEFGMIPKGWKYVSLGDLVSETLGGDWGKESLVNDFVNEVHCIRGTDIPNLKNGLLGAIPSRFLKGTSVEKRALNEGEIVLEKSGGSPTQSTGRSLLVTNSLLQKLEKPLVYTNFCIRIKAKEIEFSTLLYLELSRLYEDDIFFSIENGTTGIKNLNIKSLFDEFKVCLPPKSILKDFNEKAIRYFELIHKNGFEIQSLEKTRNYLLPRLLTGEIDATKVEKQVEEVL